MPKDIPEHLKLPQEWIDGVYRAIEPSPQDDHWSDDLVRQFEEIVQEIGHDHNPKRLYYLKYGLSLLNMKRCIAPMRSMN